MATEPVLDYVGVLPCGCITAWMSHGCTGPQVCEFYLDMAITGREVRLVELESVRDVIGRNVCGGEHE